jgi:thioredoxin reductase (NADPH)
VENLPTLICMGLIALLFVVPMWAYINITERRARLERDKAIEAGRHEPVTIQPYVDLSVCMGSGACVPACPEDVLKVIDGQAIAVNMSACIGHGACVTACPVGAIELVFGSEKRGIDIPRVGPDFQSNVPGVYIAGELGGMGLIANAAEQGVKALENLLPGLTPNPELPSVAIVGAGPAGIAAAAAARARGVSYVLLDQDALGGALRHYPRKKLVFTRTMDIPSYGRVNLKTLRKEELVQLFEDIVGKLGLEPSTGERVDKITGSMGNFTIVTSKRTLRAQRVILALGRRGTPRKLEVPGEEQEKVAYSLLEPDHYQYDHLMVVGGGDSAVEAALQLSEQPGNKVYLSYRGEKINRPKEKNLKFLKDAVKVGKVELLLESQVKEIGSDRITMEMGGETKVLPNDYVFVMVGGVLPTKFLQDVGIKIQKHYGKRVEAMEEEAAAAKSPPPSADPVSRPTLSFIQAPVDSQSIDETPIQRAKGNEEPTVSLDLSALDLSVLEPEIAALLAPAVRPPGEQTAPNAGAPRSASGLSRLGTAALPSQLGDEPVDEVVSPALASQFGDGPRRKEVTEIQPLKKVGIDGPPAARESTVLLPDTASSGLATETTLPLPSSSPSASSSSSSSEATMARPELQEGAPRTGQVGAYRVVARKERGSVAPAADPGPAPASPLSARLSRPGARTAWPESMPPEPRPGFEVADTPAALAEPRPSGAPRPRTGAVRLPGGAAGGGPGGPNSPGSASPGTTSVIQPFVDAAQQLISSGKYDEALHMCAELGGLVDRSSSALAPLAAREAKRGVDLLEGEARLGLGQWAHAIPPLEAALEAARELSPPDVVGRTLLGLARACHHTHEYERAQHLLDEALGIWTTAPPRERSQALRLLGDLALRRGDVDAAETRMQDALESAQRASSPDAEGRAYRGLANCMAIRGNYPEAIEQLGEALDRIGQDGEPAVIAAMLIRLIELENVLGRYGSALEHGERLVEVTRTGHLAAYAAEGLALVGETLVAIGQREDALEAANQAAALVKKLGQRGAEAGPRVGRVLCDLGKHKEALAVLDAMGAAAESLVDDPVAQLLAVRARALAKTDPALSKELANSALGRPAPLLAMRAARILLDAALAMHEAGSHSGARTAVKRGLKVLQGSGNKGLKLELLVAMYVASPDHRVVEAAARTAQRVMEDLPPHALATFRARPVISEALARWQPGA